MSGPNTAQPNVYTYHVFLSYRRHGDVETWVREYFASELARKLTGVVTDVESTLAAPEVRRKAVDEAQLNRLFDELDFGGMLRQRCLRS